MKFELHTKPEEGSDPFPEVLTATDKDLDEMPDESAPNRSIAFSSQDIDLIVYTADPAVVERDGEWLHCEYGQELDPAKMEIGRKYPAFDLEGSNTIWNEADPEQYLVRVE